MVLPFLIPAAATIAAGALSAGSAAQQNRMQRAMAREQMAFQERMSSTAYQRAVADMRAAGINPMLAVDRGGASSPGGAQAQMVSPLGGAVSSAMQMRRLHEEIKTMQENRRLLSEQANKTHFEAETEIKRRENMRLLNDYQFIMNQIANYDAGNAKVVHDVTVSDWGKTMEKYRRLPGIGNLMPNIGIRR